MNTDTRLNEFLSELSSKSHTPGGGSVAALTGALSAALVSMVSNLTLANKKYADVHDEMNDLLEKAKAEQEDLEYLIQHDIEAFNDVMDAVKLPKTNDEEREVRKEAIHRSMKKATMAPLRTMEHSETVLKLAVIAAEKGNKYAVSDAGVSAVLAKAAAESAFFNILINRSGIHDDQFNKEVDEKSRLILDNVSALESKVSEMVISRIK